MIGPGMAVYKEPPPEAPWTPRVFEARGQDLMVTGRTDDA